MLDLLVYTGGRMLWEAFSAPNLTCKLTSCCSFNHTILL
jgi:hypothetical protein